MLQQDKDFGIYKEKILTEDLKKEILVYCSEINVVKEKLANKIYRLLTPALKIANVTCRVKLATREELTLDSL